MFLRDLVDITEYNQMVDAGYINVRKHPEYDLYISNYSQAAQFEQKWIPSIMHSRGLITDDQDKIIARPWKKFFNLGEKTMICQFDDPVEVMDKLDGSLGILYPTPTGRHAIATRGSFESDQARHATHVWQNVKEYDEMHRQELKTTEYTFLFEIVYPENRIVLDYGDTDDLILLGAVHTELGYYYGPKGAAGILNWSGPVAEVLPHKTISEALHDTARANAEGFVIRYHNNLVKLKQPDYLELHKLRFEMSPIRIWENLRSGRNIQEIVQVLPDEFQTEILEIAQELTQQFTDLMGGIVDRYMEEEDKGHDSRRKWAHAIQGYEHRAAIFSLLDKKNIVDYCWDKVRPKANEIKVQE